MEHIGNRMRKAIDDRGLTITEVAERMGITRASLIYYLDRPGAPKDRRLEQFCEAVGCRMEEIRGTRPGVGRIPVYGDIAAGIPIEAIENVIDYEEVSLDVYKNISEYFALRLKGVSMQPRMRSGDIVIFHRQETADNEDIVAVFVGGENATCKQLLLDQEGITLHAFNESFGDMKFSCKQVETLPVTILGKAVELRAKL